MTTKTWHLIFLDPILYWHMINWHMMFLFWPILNKFDYYKKKEEKTSGISVVTNTIKWQSLSASVLKPRTPSSLIITQTVTKNKNTFFLLLCGHDHNHKAQLQTLSQKSHKENKNNKKEKTPTWPKSHHHNSPLQTLLQPWKLPQKVSKTVTKAWGFEEPHSCNNQHWRRGCETRPALQGDRRVHRLAADTRGGASEAHWVLWEQQQQHPERWTRSAAIVASLSLSLFFWGSFKCFCFVLSSMKKKKKGSLAFWGSGVHDFFFIFTRFG